MRVLENVEGMPFDARAEGIGWTFETALDVMVELALTEGLEARFGVAVVNDDDDQIAELLQYPDLLLGLSDAGAHTSQLCDANYATWLLASPTRSNQSVTPSSVTVSTAHR